MTATKTPIQVTGEGTSPAMVGTMPAEYRFPTATFATPYGEITLTARGQRTLTARAEELAVNGVEYELSYGHFYLHDDSYKQARGGSAPGEPSGELAWHPYAPAEQWWGAFGRLPGLKRASGGEPTTVATEKLHETLIECCALFPQTRLDEAGEHEREQAVKERRAKLEEIHGAVDNILTEISVLEHGGRIERVAEGRHAERKRQAVIDASGVDCGTVTKVTIEQPVER